MAKSGEVASENDDSDERFEGAFLNRSVRFSREGESRKFNVDVVRSGHGNI